MRFFAFGLTRANASGVPEHFGSTKEGSEADGVDGSGLGTHTFFESPVRSIEHRGLAVFGVEAHGPPARTDETLLAFDRVVREIARERPVVPHRFGVVTTSEAITADLAEHHDVLTDALARVEGRDEWTIRIRPRVDDVLRAVPASVTEELRRFATPLERGGAVHQVLTQATHRMAGVLVDRLGDAGWPARSNDHADGLGADVITLIDRVADVPDRIADLTEEPRRISDVELIGPGPAYRFAALVTGRLLGAGRHDAQPLDAHGGHR